MMMSSPDVPSRKLHSTQEVWKVSFGQQWIITYSSSGLLPLDAPVMTTEKRKPFPPPDHSQPERLTKSLSGVCEGTACPNRSNVNR